MTIITSPYDWQEFLEIIEVVKPKIIFCQESKTQYTNYYFSYNGILIHSLITSSAIETFEEAIKEKNKGIKFWEANCKEIEEAEEILPQKRKSPNAHSAGKAERQTKKEV